MSIVFVKASRRAKAYTRSSNSNRYARLGKTLDKVSRRVWHGPTHISSKRLGQLENIKYKLHSERGSIRRKYGVKL